MTDDARYRADTIADLYRVIWRITGRQQLLLIALAVIVAALAAAPLKFQQLVINSLVYGGDIYRVAWLCAGLLGVTLLSAALSGAARRRQAERTATRITACDEPLLTSPSIPPFRQVQTSPALATNSFPSLVMVSSPSVQ